MRVDSPRRSHRPRSAIGDFDRSWSRQRPARFNTGAFDDLAAVAAVCRAERLWFHVDGASAPCAPLRPVCAISWRGIEQADSVAFRLP